MSTTTKIVSEIIILMNLTLTLKWKMNILNFFNITKMTNKFAEFKNYLKLLWPEERLSEINFMINEFDRSNRNGDKIAKNNK